VKAEESSNFKDQSSRETQNSKTEAWALCHLCFELPLSFEL
jgi:hypothetical protein